MIESAVVKKIKDAIKELEYVEVKKIHSGMTGRDVDLLIVILGQACFYEIKKKGEKATDWQLARLRQWHKAKAMVGVYDNAEDCIKEIKRLHYALMKTQARRALDLARYLKEFDECQT